MAKSLHFCKKLAPKRLGLPKTGSAWHLSGESASGKKQSNAKNQEPNSNNSAPGPWDLVLGSWNLVLGLCFLGGRF
jgi:hypothetical protein